MKNALVKKCLSLLLAIVMVVSLLPLNSLAIEKKDSLNFGLMSDMHFYPKELTGNYCEAFLTTAKSSIGRNLLESEALLDCALAAYAENAKKNNLEYLVLPGDLTSNGEYVAHVKLAERLEKFEKETGIQVIAINGNHDIVKKAGETFVNGKSEDAKRTTPEDFLEIYKNLGYDIAYHRYVPADKDAANRLSYSVRAGKYRFIVMDTSAYSPDVTKSGEYDGETRGCMTDSFVKWVLDEIADAKSAGEVAIGVNHHNFAYHFKSEYTILRGFVIDDFQYLGETFAKAGMNFALTGHIHQNDIARVITDDGDVLNEICSPSLSAFPNYFREVYASTNSNGETTLQTKNYDVDCVKAVEVNGHTYAKPYRVESLKITYTGYNGFADKAGKLILNLLDKYSKQLGEEGIVEFLKGMGVDLKEVFEGFIGDGLKIGDNELFTADNLILFVEDLFNQVYELYLTDPARTAEYLTEQIQKLVEIQVSELPCTALYEEYGVGDPTRAGNLEDLLGCVLVYLYGGETYMEDDAFFMDALYQLENGDTAFKLFDALLEFVSDLVQNKVLGSIDFRPVALFPEGEFMYKALLAVDRVANFFFRGDTTYLNIINTVLGFGHAVGIIDYTSLWNILENLIEEYVTDTQIQGIGQTISAIVKGFAQDTDFREDGDATVTYTGRVAVEATRDNYRLPTAVTVTLGQDYSSRNISWYTKNTVDGSDIEIIEKTETPAFTGKNTYPADVKVIAKTEKTMCEYPGVDLGVAGIMNYEFEMNRHIINVSGLEKGKTYLYRVGDASRNWWSQTGSFKVENGGTETSFIHIGDPQSQSAQQYETFSKLISKAYELYDSDFILDTGDNVDHGNNFNQWRWFLDEASDTLMNTVLMSASGNHEGNGEYAIDKNFVYSNVPEQDVESGIYFSFDYNNIHVAVLNSNDLDKDNSLADKQIEWLKQDMRASDADWKFVAIHKAPYSNGSHYDDKDVIKIRDELCKLMPELGIDIVFQGHDHVYLRTDSMIDNKVESVTTSTATFDGKEYTVKNNPVGTVYVISGCAGVKIYDQKDPSLTDKYFPRAETIEEVPYSVFSGVHIVDDTLYFDAYSFDTATGATENIDSFAIKKDLSVDKGYITQPTFMQKVLRFLKDMFTKVSSLLKPIF